MSIKGEIAWEGLEAFRDYATRILPAAIRASAEEACDRAGDDGEEFMRMFVPVRTGLLRSTCRKLSGREPIQAGFFHVILAAGGMMGCDYAGYVEYGTSRQLPQPYLRPALRRASRNIPGYFWEELAKRVELE